MELKSSYPCLQPSSTLPPASTRRNSFHGVGADTAAAAAGGERGRKSFGATFNDSLCNLNLKGTSECARSTAAFPMATTARSSSSNGHGHGHGRQHEAASSTSSSSSSAASAQRRRADHHHQQQVVVPATPGRPLQFFASPAHHNQLVAPRRSVPSKWDDAEKWLRQSSDSEHHYGGNGNGNGNGKAAFPRQRSGGMGQRGGGEEERRVPVMVRRSVDALPDAQALALYTPPAEVFLKDKFTDNEEPSTESFVFQSSYRELGDKFSDNEDLRKDVGTEMTPLGSGRTSRCQTPVKSASPARHNTPADRSGPLVPYVGGGGGGGGTDISELADCHLAKLDLGARFDSVMLVNWSSKEEEEEDVSKSLRHFEAITAGAGVGAGLQCDRRGCGDCRWEDDDRAKSCIRYQREEAKIQAWINLESAKAEAQSRKLEVKIQKMRSNLEDKLMRRMSTVHRRAEEWRATARAQHAQQLRRAGDSVRRLKAASHHRHPPGSDVAAASVPCGCFPSNGDVVGSSGNLLNYYH